MSESVARKVQPFTIGTKLSAPAVPKCPGFAEAYLSNRAFSDDCKLQRRLNEQVSLYLGRARRCGPAAAPVTFAKHRREEMSDEDQPSVNTASLSRSIRKIAISGSAEAGTSPETRLKRSTNSENNNNNNNVTTSKTAPPKIVGVSCENKPNSHFKVSRSYSFGWSV